MKLDNSERLFTHPLVFLLTHVVFPLLALAGAAFLYWITKEALDGALRAKGVAFAAGAALLPALGLVSLAVRRGRPQPLWEMFAFAFAAAALLYLGVPVAGEMSGKVDGWIIGVTPFLALFSGLMPMIFSGAASFAGVKLPRVRPALDVGISVCALPATLFAAWVCIGIWSQTVFWGHAHALLCRIAVNICVILLFALTFVFFVALLRLMFLVSRLAGEKCGRTAAVMVCALVLPLGGLALNLHIPFPADFANPWPWAFSVLTTLALLPKPRADRLGLYLYYVQSLVGPFVIYFFLLFVPFLPLAIPAILAVGAGFLILAPTILFRFYTREMFAYWRRLREAYPARVLVAVAAAGFLTAPAFFFLDAELERRDVKALLAWHTAEDFDAPPAPLPFPKARAAEIMRNINDYTFGAEIPFLSAWRTCRVYDGMYLADGLRNELNRRILGEEVDDARDNRARSRNLFAGGMFGANAARRNGREAARWRTAPSRTLAYTASAEPLPGEGARFKVTVRAEPVTEGGQRELALRFRLPAGAWIDGMRLKLADGTWKTARASERKAAEWVYRKITERRLDPSIVTLDSPTEGTFRIFPVGSDGREAELTLCLPDAAAAKTLISLKATGRKRVERDAKKRKVTIPAKETDWLDVANPAFDASAAPRLYRASGAALTVVGAEWMAAHLDALLKPGAGEPRTLYRADPELWGTARRAARAAMRALPADPSAAPAFAFSAGEGPALPEDKLAILRREYPGVAAFGDRPVEGWFVFKTADGGAAAAPYRPGEGAVVFAALAGAEETGGAWAAGAAAWALENEAFLKPALDARAELLRRTRESGALTTRSAYIAVETAAQEKALGMKESDALRGDQNLDFEEPAQESSDAPGLLLLLALIGGALALHAAFRARRARVALLALALAAPCFGRTVHRSFRQGRPVTPSTSPNARNYTGPGMITRRDATPAFDFFSNGRFAIAGVHLGDLRHEVVSAASKAGAQKVQERVLEEKDGQPLVKEMLLLGGAEKGVLVGRTGPQGGAQTEYRVSQVSVLLRSDRVTQVQAVFYGDHALLARYRDWMVPVFDKKCGRNPANGEILPKTGFGGEPDEPRANTWKWSGITFELRYEPGPSRLILAAHR